MNDSKTLKDGIYASKEEKAKAIFDELVYQLKNYCGMHYPVSIKTYNKYNIVKQTGSNPKITYANKTHISPKILNIAFSIN